ncbi:MAG: GldG family protein [Gammaproteobacteria bacterium]|nr:GldG family protein [Gammaproteobacteria bacterium]
MNINPKTRFQLQIQQFIFYVLVIIVVTLLAQLTLKTNVRSDWTANSRHSLSDSTKDVLKQLDDDVTIQVFISPDSEYHSALESLLSRYQQHSDKLNVIYINPDFSPEIVRKLNIQQQGEMVVSLNDKQQHVFDLSEQSLTNALIIVSRAQQPWLVFIEGHGERSPFSQANFNLSVWGEQLKQKGFKLQSLNLVEQSLIPNNAAAVVIASPERPWLAGEIDIIKNYITDGGNLLWLTEPDSHQYLAGLAEQLGIEFVPGTIIDPNAELLGITDPQFVLITNYANHPVATATTSVTLFPQAVAIENNVDNSAWQYLPLLTSQENTWSETDPITQATVASPIFDVSNDTGGPLNLAYLLTVQPVEEDEKNKEQRIAVIGDGDFLSNSYIGNGSNLELGVALMNWLAEDDSLIDIPIKTTIDNQLQLTTTQSLIIGLGFLIVIPVLLLSIGLGLWWYRRKQ